MRYNKLVRDKIPEHIASQGGTYAVHTADKQEFWQKLKQKLAEETQEFTASENPEEIADILEVISAIQDFKKWDAGYMEKLRREKFQKRGGFAKRIILEES